MGLVTITVAGILAGLLITITAPPMAACIMVIGVAAICVISYFLLKKAGG